MKQFILLWIFKINLWFLLFNYYNNYDFYRMINDKIQIKTFQNYYFYNYNNNNN